MLVSSFDTEWASLKTEIESILALRSLKAKVVLSEELYPKLISFIAKYETADNTLVEQNKFIVSSLGQYIDLSVKPIEEAAKNYFCRLYREQELAVSFSPKMDGDQLGTVIHLDFQAASGAGDGIISRISYHVKTHQLGGLKRGGKIEPVDLKELLVYKVLAYMGYGPKAYFFTHPLLSTVGGVYIATQTSAYSKCHKDKSFLIYAKYRDEADSVSSKEAQTGICLGQILISILGLHDLLDNSGNFGKVLYADKSEKWKMIDFRVMSREDYVEPHILERFMSAPYGGPIEAFFQDKTSFHTRLTIAQEILDNFTTGRLRRDGKGSKMPFIIAMDAARADIIDFLESNALAGVDKAKSLADLDAYIAAAKLNFVALGSAVEACQAHGKAPT